MDQKSFCLNQKKLIERAKWLEGERLGHDPGPEFVERWVQQNARRYRQEYQQEYQKLVTEVANRCRSNLEAVLPGVSPDLWDAIFKMVIDQFTVLWTKELIEEESEDRKRHLEEI